MRDDWKPWFYLVFKANAHAQNIHTYLLTCDSLKPAGDQNTHTYTHTQTPHAETYV